MKSLILSPQLKNGKISREKLLSKGLDKFGDVYERVDWDKGFVGQFVHDTSRLALSSARKLVQAINRERKRESDESQSSFSSKFYDSQMHLHLASD